MFAPLMSLSVKSRLAAAFAAQDGPDAFSMVSSACSLLAEGRSAGPRRNGTANNATPSAAAAAAIQRLRVGTGASLPAAAAGALEGSAAGSAGFGVSWDECSLVIAAPPGLGSLD